MKKFPGKLPGTFYRNKILIFKPCLYNVNKVIFLMWKSHGMVESTSQKIKWFIYSLLLFYFN